MLRQCSTQAVFISLCFLVLDETWPDTSNSCHRYFPTMKILDCEPNKPFVFLSCFSRFFFLCLFCVFFFFLLFSLSQQWEKISEDRFKVRKIEYESLGVIVARRTNKHAIPPSLDTEVRARLQDSRSLFPGLSKYVHLTGYNHLWWLKGEEAEPGKWTEERVY